MIRTVYREAEPGIAMLEPRVRPCIRTAFVLYRGILDAVAADDYRVVHRRSVVPRRRMGRRRRAGLARILGARVRTRTTAPEPGVVAGAEGSLR